MSSRAKGEGAVFIIDNAGKHFPIAAGVMAVEDTPVTRARSVFLIQQRLMMLHRKLLGPTRIFVMTKTNNTKR